MDFVGIFCVVLIVGAFLYWKFGGRSAQRKKAIENQEQETSAREEFAMHYRQSEDVDNFANRIADKCAEYINSCFKFEEESYLPKYSVLIRRDKIEHRSDKILQTSSYRTTYSHSGIIIFASENIKDIDRHAKLLALGDVLSEKVQQYVLERVPVGPDGKKGSCYVTRHDSEGNASVHIPEETSLNFRFRYTNHFYAEQKREL